MIASLQGIVQFKGKDWIAIQVNGVGYLTYSLDRLVNAASVGDDIHVFTALIVREDSLTLYGFPELADREVFEILITVSGVGPRLGLAILNTLQLDHLRNAIASERDDLLTRVPGIGSKTAKKIVLELKDKFRTLASAPLDFADGQSEVNADVVDALIALGFSVVEAQTALQALPPNTPQDVEERIRLALQRLG